MSGPWRVIVERDGGASRADQPTTNVESRGLLREVEITVLRRVEPSCGKHDFDWGCPECLAIPQEPVHTETHTHFDGADRPWWRRWRPR